MVGHVFPKGFLWGVSTSAQQIEGAADEGGRGESIWDRFAATPGRIADGSTPTVACDHFHRWREDLELLQWLGIGAYRFSVAWPRVQPSGCGSINTTGLDFYDQLVDALLEAHIQPFVTLYHWDLPQALQDRGGWVARDTAEAFVDYASAVVSRLGDRVRFWVTHNEPWCVAHLGYENGEHAPGHRDPVEALRAAHHVLLSHGWAVKAIREQAPGADVGIVLNLTPGSSATRRPADREAARCFDGFMNRWFLDPLFRGRYPQDAIEDRVRQGQLPNPELDFVEPGDLGAISVPTDFLGVNYYSRLVLRSDTNGQPEPVAMVPEEKLTDMGWEVYPQGLYDLLMRLDRDYAPSKIYVTENGAAYGDWLNSNARIEDARRIEYLQGHLVAAHRAIEAGVPLRGYFVWSLLDNFEWAHGYAMRFGIVGVDYESQRRIRKDSAFWYRDVVTAGAVGTGTRELDARRFR